MVISFKKSHACTATLSAPTLQQTTTNPHVCWRLDINRQVWVRIFRGHCSFLLSPGAQGPLCPPRVYFPVLCKFWQLYGEAKGNLHQDGLCHAQICCTQSPCPYDSPLLTDTSTGGSQTQFCLSLCGVLGSWCAQGLSETSECLTWNGEWGLTWVSLTLDVVVFQVRWKSLRS